MCDTINTMRWLIPVGTIIATMAASVLVAHQSSAVPALSARIHDELKPSADSLLCAVTGPLNDSAAFEDDTAKFMLRSFSGPHVERSRSHDLITAYDKTSRCPLRGPCTKNSAWYTEMIQLFSRSAQRGQASSGCLTGFVRLPWTAVVIGVLIYIACKVRLEARIPSRLNSGKLRIGAPSPSLAHPWQRKKYDLAALEIGLCGVFAYVVWALGCVLAALRMFPTDLNMTLVVLVPLTIGMGLPVVTVMG